MTYNKKTCQGWHACSHFVATFLLFLLLASAALVQADQFKVHYSIRGSGKDIIVSANSSDRARHTVEDMLPGAVVTGVRRERGK
jgi:hypothetical protein